MPALKGQNQLLDAYKTKIYVKKRRFKIYDTYLSPVICVPCHMKKKQLHRIFGYSSLMIKRTDTSDFDMTIINLKQEQEVNNLLTQISIQNI